MKFYLPSLFLLSTSWCTLCRAQDVPIQVPSLGTNAQEAVKQHDGEVLIIRIRAGDFVEADSNQELESIQNTLAGISVRQPSVKEAKEIWGRNASIMEVTKSLTRDHYLISLRDSRNVVFLQSITPIPIPAATLKALQDSLTRQKVFVALLNAADAKTGEERLAILINIMQSMGASSFKFVYPELAAEVSSSASPSAKAARDQLATAGRDKDREAKVNRLHFDLSMEFRKLPHGTPLEQRVALVDAFIVEKALDPEMKQLMIMRKYLLWSNAGKFDKALAALDEAYLTAPASELAGRIPLFREVVRKNLKEAASAPDPTHEPEESVEPSRNSEAKR